MYPALNPKLFPTKKSALDKLESIFNTSWALATTYLDRASDSRARSTFIADSHAQAAFHYEMEADSYAHALTHHPSYLGRA